MSLDAEGAASAFSRLADATGRLSFTGVCLTLMLIGGLAGGGVLGYGIWEARSQWSSVAWQSPTLMASIGGGLVLTLIGGVIGAQQKRLVKTQEALVQQLETALRTATEEVRQVRREAADRETALNSKILELVIVEAKCQQRVTRLEERMKMAGIPDD